MHSRLTFDLTSVTGTLGTWSSAIPLEVDGCSECNRAGPKPWPVFTVNYHGVQCCAKCLTSMSLPRKPRG